MIPAAGAKPPVTSILIPGLGAGALAGAPPLPAPGLPGGLPPAFMAGLSGLPLPPMPGMLPGGMPGFQMPGGLPPGIPGLPPLGPNGLPMKGAIPDRKGIQAFGPALPPHVINSGPSGARPGIRPSTAPGILGAATTFNHLVKPASPQETEKNRQVLDVLLPMIAGKIDENGGVHRITDLCEMKEVKEQIAQIPVSFPKALPKILQQWPNFFVTMQNGLIGTSMGYDTGMIRPDGNLDPAYESMFKAKVGQPPKTLETFLKEEAINNPKIEERLDLNEAADELWRACLNLEDDAGLYGAYQKMTTARSQAKRELGMEGNQGGKVIEKDQRRRRVLQRVIEMLVIAPDRSLNLSIIVQDPQVQELKKGAVSRFLAFLKEYAENFEVIAVENGTQYKVTLINPSLRSPPVNHPPPNKRHKKNHNDRW